MDTRVTGKEIEVTISPEKPVVMIGEKINPTGHKKLAAALKEEQYDYISELAQNQIAAGAHILDVNVGAPGVDEPTVLPLVKEHGAAVIGLTMDDTGIPETAEARLVIAGRIVERALKLGIPLEDVVIDPLVLTVGADQNAAQATMETIRLVRNEFGVNINLGASNESFSLPDRQAVNQAFLAMTVVMGANCMITDPMNLAGTIFACDLLTGKDLYGKNYITHVRKTLKR